MCVQYAIAARYCDCYHARDGERVTVFYPRLSNLLSWLDGERSEAEIRGNEGELSLFTSSEVKNSRADLQNSDPCLKYIRSESECTHEALTPVVFSFYKNLILLHQTLLLFSMSNIPENIPAGTDLFFFILLTEMLSVL